MKRVLIPGVVVLGVLAAAAAAADTPSAEAKKVLARYRAALPAAADLTVYSLDWVPTLGEAKQKAAREKRPILLIVVTNSYGNLYTGHC